MHEIRLSEGDGDFPGSAAIVSDLIRSFWKGQSPEHWEHDIAYNYLVHQGTVLSLAEQAFPYLIAVLKDAPLKRELMEALVHLCSMIYPQTQRSVTDRAALLIRIGELLQPDRRWSDKVYLLSAYARVAGADSFLADSLESLLQQSCPHCGELVLSGLTESSP
jgi:hypothetical protein